MVIKIYRNKKFLKRKDRPDLDWTDEILHFIEEYWTYGVIENGYVYPYDKEPIQKEIKKYLPMRDLKLVSEEKFKIHSRIYPYTKEDAKILIEDEHIDEL